MWFDFNFKGSKSQVRVSDGSYVTMRPKEMRFKQGISVMIEQVYQIMRETMGLKVQKSSNLYEICEKLSQCIMS